MDPDPEQDPDSDPYLWLVDPDPGAQKHVDPDPQHCCLLTSRLSLVGPTGTSQVLLLTPGGHQPRPFYNLDFFHFSSVFL